VLLKFFTFATALRTAMIKTYHARRTDFFWIGAVLLESGKDFCWDRRSSQSMAQIRVSDETYARLVRVKAKLEEVTGRPVSFCEALIYLCDLFQKNWGDDVILPDMSPKRRH
jgi:hypothetical protein